MTNKKADRTILAITDFTKSSTDAILFAARLFKNCNLRLKLLHIYDNPNNKLNLLISVDDILLKDSETGLKKQLTEVISAEKKLKSKITTHSATGNLKKVIDSISKAEKINLILAGSYSTKCHCKNLNNIPILFMGQNNVPLLMVPEQSSYASVKNVLVLNLNLLSHKNSLGNKFEHIVNHDHIAKHTINLNEKKIDRGALESFYLTLKEKSIDLIVIIPAAGDKIDSALIQHNIPELCPLTATLLNCELKY